MISIHFTTLRKLNLMIVLSLLITPFSSFAQDELAKKKTIMLILGSDDINTLKARVDIGYQLYESAVDFDYIIVSGGCAAHKSQVCEASEMASLLIKKGVPAEKVFKEEKSKNTVQNYVYSRVLKKSDGTHLINPNDSLYVVSNHWHAISVAARFATYDHVNAVYHIEGSILPSTKDKVDYTDIYHKNADNEDYVKKALWPFIDASYTLYDLKGKTKEKTYQFMGDLLYQEAYDDEKESATLISEAFSGLPRDWHKNIDASFYNPIENKLYVFKGLEYVTLNPNKKVIDKGYPKPIVDLLNKLPANWEKGHIDAALFNPLSKEIFLFKGNEYLIVHSKNKRIDNKFPKNISSFASNWPFEWGSGDVDAAHYSSAEKKIYLFRGKEYIKVSLDGQVENGYPQNIKLEWPEAVYGKRN